MDHDGKLDRVILDMMDLDGVNTRLPPRPDLYLMWKMHDSSTRAFAEMEKFYSQAHIVNAGMRRLSNSLFVIAAVLLVVSAVLVLK